MARKYTIIIIVIIIIIIIITMRLWKGFNTGQCAWSEGRGPSDDPPASQESPH